MEWNGVEWSENEHYLKFTNFSLGSFGLDVNCQLL